MAPLNTPSQFTLLLLGSGGREHALAWKLSQSQSLARLVCAPGNPGMAGLGELRAVNIEDGEAVVALAHEVGANLVVVGPEAPLAAGVSDALRAHGIPTFGPSRSASRLEWDKAFAKDFMNRHGIATAASRTFQAIEIEAAREFVQVAELPLVIKASGLAAGKGVVIAATIDEALDALDGMLSGTMFGAAGACVVIEEFMKGEEASIFAITDGERYVLLAPSQDHKRVGDGDAGPNTGGMGAYAPAPIVGDELLERVAHEIVEPTLNGMREEGNRYVGCLYVGLMIDGARARVVEYNSRFGDPETQVVLPLLDADLAELLYAAATASLADLGDIHSRGSAVCIVMASEGYPGSYRKGDAITGIAEAERLDGVVVFHAGTRRDGEDLVTSGGRVLGVTAISKDDDLELTAARAYRAVEAISFQGGFCRHDIARKGIEFAKPKV
jgi:phosphoribosylamine--glycine ligase